MGGFYGRQEGLGGWKGGDCPVSRARSGAPGHLLPGPQSRLTIEVEGIGELVSSRGARSLSVVYLTHDAIG